MKYLFIVGLLLSFSNKSWGAQLYCETEIGKASPYPDPNILPSQAFDWYRGMLLGYQFPYGVDKCGPEQYPELLKLFNILLRGSEAYKISGFNFYETYSGKFIIQEFEKISTVKFDESEYMHPFDAYRFITFVKTKKLPSKLDKSNFKIKIAEYRADLKAKTEAHDKKALEEKSRLDKEKQLQNEKIEVEKLKPEIEYYKKYFYISKIIEKGELVSNDSKEFINNKMADSIQDFKERVVLACFEMNCPSKWKKKFSQELQNNLNFKIGDKSPLYYSVKYNNFDEFKKNLDLDKEHNFSYDIYSLSLHLKNDKIANYYTREIQVDPKNITYDYAVLEKILPQKQLVKNLVEITKREGPNLYYSNYFMDTNNKFKPKHTLGYATAEFYNHGESLDKANKYKVKINVREIPLVGFETPSWEGKQIIIRDEKYNNVVKADENMTDYDIYSFVFSELNNHWVALVTPEKKVWIHASQVEQIHFVDEFYKNAKIHDPKLDALYDKAGGAVIPKEKSSKYTQSIKINSSKWINEELWFNIDLETNSCGDSDEGTVPVKDIWIKAFNGSSENFDHSAKGC